MTFSQATRHSATGTRASASSSAVADRGVDRRAEGPGETGSTPADRNESVERTLASDVSVGRRCANTRSLTELGDLDRYTLTTLQQMCRDLHIKIGGNKEEVVRRITDHKIDQEESPGSDARRRPSPGA